jgi:protein-tyrosine phosphatase
MKVLFVCQGNAFRSPVAEALLKKLRPDIEVDSAGVYPSIPVSEHARRYLAEEDAERFLKRTPESLGQKNLSSYDLIVAMEPVHRDIIVSKCPECAKRTVVWGIDDPYFMSSMSAEKVFKLIKAKVEALAGQL